MTIHDVTNLGASDSHDQTIPSWKERCCLGLSLLALLALIGLSGNAHAQSSDLSIPLQTWVARPLPGCATAPCQNIKDMRGLYDSSAKKTYFFGGDHNGSSGYAALYSYNVLTDQWILEHDVCTPSGTEQPAHPDEGTFVYDSRQQNFWWIPGFSHPGNGDNCQSTLGYFTTLSYNTNTGRWTSSNYVEPPTYGSEIGIYGVFDPITNTIIRLLGNNGVPSRQTYDIATNTWSTKSFPGMPTPGGQSSASTSQSAIDVIGRKVYVLDPFYDVLWVYSIDSDTLSVQSNVPFHISAYSVEWNGQFNMRLYWDSINKVLLFPQINGNEGLVRLHAYKPSTNIWEVQKAMTTLPAGITVRGNGGVFDPAHNVLIFFGGSGSPNPYLFLYRYGTGSGSDLTPPVAPTGLRVS